MTDGAEENSRRPGNPWIILLVFAGVFIVGLGAISLLGQRFVSPGITQHHAAQIEAALRSKLKDPDSLKVTWWTRHGDVVYCALYNAKNSFGGYGGSEPFAAMVMWNIGDHDEVQDIFFDHAIIKTLCGEAYGRELKSAGFGDMAAASSMTPDRENHATDH